MNNHKPLDFSLFSDRQLVDLLTQVYAEVLKRREAARKLGEQRRGLAENTGPKYRNPANSAETWSGRGRMPGWIRRALASGQALEELEIGD